MLCNFWYKKLIRESQCSLTGLLSTEGLLVGRGIPKLNLNNREVRTMFGGLFFEWRSSS